MITATIGLALPAHAQTDTCNVVVSSCTTDTIPSNSSGKWIKYQIENAAWDDSNFAIYDADTGVIVRQGYVGTGNFRGGTVYGLYGRYYLHVYNSSFDTIGSIWNE